jgi:hypothetical protein
LDQLFAQLTYIVFVLCRLAHALASSFNFQGRVKKTFYVLTDDKVGAGPQLRPNSLAKDSGKSANDSGKSVGQGTSRDTDTAQPMETDPPTVLPVMSLSAKLAAKRKLNDGAASSDSAAKARR